MVPDGAQHLSAVAASVSFLSGALCFLLADWLVQRSGGSAAQLMAMLLDFVPEAIAMGAVFASASRAGLLLAFLIGLQNLPEGFNAYREMRAGGSSSRPRILVSFALLSLLGPAAAWSGITVLAGHPVPLAHLMIFCGGGILYLTFQDIAPQAKLDHRWWPALGAVCGFLLGLVGQMLLVGGGA
jgi:ZIP family zinc transporter